MLHKLHPVSWSAAAKNDASVGSRAHMHTPTSSSINSRFTQQKCVPLCWKRHALITCTRNSNDNSTTGVVTAALLDNLFTVLMPIQHKCVPLCWKRHALIPCTRCAYVGHKCDLTITRLPWQCLPCESAVPCFMAGGSTQNVYTTRPLSSEDETMMQALHDR